MKYFSLLLILFGSLLGCDKEVTSNESIPSDKSSITLFFIPSPFGINWESPRKLLTSIALNYFSFRSHFMGHVNIHVGCTDLNETEQNFITGMSHQNLPAANDIFVKQAGLGVMFVKNPGRLDDEPKTEAEIVSLLKNPGTRSGINFFRIKVSKATCSRITQYFKEYKEHKIWRYYGLYNRPLYGEGAGCSAFGASFLQVSGIMNQEIEQQWTYHLKLPKDLIGPPFFEQKVPFWKVFLRKSWGEDDDSSMDFTFWEPDKMYYWVTNTLKNLKNQSQYSSTKLYQTVGVLYDAKNIPVPTEPIWKKSDRPFYSELIELNQALFQPTM